MRESFVFYKSFWDALKNLDDKTQAAAFKALAEYALEGTEPSDENPLVYLFFVMARPQVDANERKRQNGKKGGRPSGSEEPIAQTNNQTKASESNRNQTKAKETITEKSKPNVNVNVNVNEKERDYDQPQASAVERTNSNTTQPVQGIDQDQQFDRFWREYPRKVGKSQAKKIFTKLKPSEELVEEIILALESQKNQKGWQDPQYIPHPSTWLNQRRWEDEVEQEPARIWIDEDGAVHI